MLVEPLRVILNGNDCFYFSYPELNVKLLPLSFSEMKCRREVSGVFLLLLILDDNAFFLLFLLQILKKKIGSIFFYCSAKGKNIFKLAFRKLFVITTPLVMATLLKRSKNAVGRCLFLVKYSLGIRIWKRKFKNLSFEYTVCSIFWVCIWIYTHIYEYVCIFLSSKVIFKWPTV